MKTHEEILEEIEKYNVDDWGEHPRFPVEDWVYEARHNETHRSYSDWVYTQLMTEESE